MRLQACVRACVREVFAIYDNNISPMLIIKVKVWFYIAQYPDRWTAQSALHFPPLADLFIPTLNYNDNN